MKPKVKLSNLTIELNSFIGGSNKDEKHVQW